MPEYCIDWEVEIPVTLETTVTFAATEIIEADSAEAAAEKVKDDMLITGADLDLSEVKQANYEVGEPNMDSFKVNGNEEWTA